MVLLQRLPRPIVGAPMAGGPSTPALAAAVSEAGGIGFLAAGMIPTDRLIADVHATLALTRRPFGVNVFLPGRLVPDLAGVDAYRSRLAGAAARWGVPLGEP